MKEYVSPQIAVIEVEAEDILTASAIETPGVSFPKSNKLSNL